MYPKSYILTRTDKDFIKSICVLKEFRWIGFKDSFGLKQILNKKMG
jgi:hypothetical protein